MSIFIELSLIILVATLVSVVMKILKQPFIVGYILTGVLSGPYFFNIIHSKEDIELFSKIGIAILLFIVGLHMNPSVIKEIGKSALIAGALQVVVTTILGFLLVLLLGFGGLTSIYIAFALTLSSTIIVMKLLSDKGDLNALYGKISVGILLVQDLVATTVLILVTTASHSTDHSLIFLVGEILFKGAVILLALIVGSRLLIGKVAYFMAQSQELLFLFSLSWGLGIASLFFAAGYSIEIGALAAGVVLSTTPFAGEIGSRIKPLRDFFVLLFFILLGSQIQIDSLPQVLVPALLMTFFVLIGNPLILFSIMTLLGFKRRVSFLSSLNMAQVSEFSLILVTLAVGVGHISKDAASLVTLVGLLTIAGSSYLILHSEKIYSALDPLFKFLFKKKDHSSLSAKLPEHQILLFGFDRVGAEFVTAIKKLHKPYLVIDFNPQSIKNLTEQNIPCMYGDAEDREFLEELSLSEAKLIISTIPDIATNSLLIKTAREKNPDVITIVISNHVKDAQVLYAIGATYVVMPHYLGAEFASSMIVKHGLNRKKFLEEQGEHQSYINRKLAI